MKKFTLLVLLLWSINSIGQQITKQQWQEDLDYLQNLVHKEYAFLFKKVSKEEFDAKVIAFREAIPQLEDHEILVGFSRIIALFKYGHTSIYFSDVPIAYNRLPLHVYQYNDGVYIHSIHKQYAHLAGAKIVEIEGKPMEEIIDAVFPVCPAENEYFFKAYCGHHLITPIVLHAQGITSELKEKLSLKLEKDGKVITETVTALKPKRGLLHYGELKENGEWVSARDLAKTPNYLKNLDKIYYFEYLKDQKAVYVRHSQIQDDPSEDIPTFYNKVFDFVTQNEVEKLIIDVRLNGGGNNFKNKPIVTGIIANEKINKVGNLFVIIGRRTFSACQNLVNELDNYTNAIFVGEPTSENINFYGDNKREVMPNSKLPIYLSFAWWQDKPQWQNADYLAPHLPIDMTFEAYKANQDPVLEAALSFKGENYIKDPMQYLSDLFLKGDLQKVETEAVRMLKDPIYNYFDFEAQFTQAGYMMLGNNNEGALYVFTMVTNLFPDSASAWLNLAQGNEEIGNKDAAIKNYKKAIALDEEGASGKMAKKRLKNLE